MPEDIQDLKAALASNIKRLRAEAGLPQERLGLEAGVDRTVVSKIERGIANPSLEILFRVADRLGTTVSDLLRHPNKMT
jgi:transcriptional regulator with XRE-family HTH domain